MPLSLFRRCFVKHGEKVFKTLSKYSNDYDITCGLPGWQHHHEPLLTHYPPANSQERVASGCSLTNAVEELEWPVEKRDIQPNPII
jgi:hypothetical protein